jgi:hypothetical protein
MSAETAELIQEIEVERSRARKVLDETGKQLEESEAVADVPLEVSSEEADKAIDTLRRAGLIPA